MQQFLLDEWLKSKAPNLALFDIGSNRDRFRDTLKYFFHVSRGMNIDKAAGIQNDAVVVDGKRGWHLALLCSYRFREVRSVISISSHSFPNSLHTLPSLKAVNT